MLKAGLKSEKTAIKKNVSSDESRYVVSSVTKGVAHCTAWAGQGVQAEMVEMGV